MIQITQEEYDQLCKKAQAWDDHVHRRLEGGMVPGSIDIELVSGHALIRFSEWALATPFGNVKVDIGTPPKHEYNLTNPGDRVTLSTEVRLQLS